MTRQPLDHAAGIPTGSVQWVIKTQMRSAAKPGLVRDDSTDTARNPALWHWGFAVVGEFLSGAFGPVGGNRAA